MTKQEKIAIDKIKAELFKKLTEETVYYNDVEKEIIKYLIDKLHDYNKYQINNTKNSV